MPAHPVQSGDCHEEMRGYESAADERYDSTQPRLMRVSLGGIELSTMTINCNTNKIHPWR